MSFRWLYHDGIPNPIHVDVSDRGLLHYTNAGWAEGEAPAPAKKAPKKAAPETPAEPAAVEQATDPLNTNKEKSDDAA